MAELVTKVPAVVLAVYAHPDDADVGCGGTLALWADRGCAVHLVICTDGGRGTADPSVTPEALVERRTAEVAAAAEVVGVASYRLLGAPDGELDERTGFRGELVALIRGDYRFCVGAACFPEVHPQAADPLSDLQYLKTKVDCGTSFLITQLFFDNEAYFRFVDAARFAGIEVPILPGIMPITNVTQIKTITGMCGATIPPALLDQLERRADAEGGAEAVAELGVAYATLQCAELLAGGAPGIHFYTLNRSPATRAIVSALKLLEPWEGSAVGSPARQVAGP